jgi:glucosamine--fructose-6-phosphate aminotransferase (isomerizing)
VGGGEEAANRPGKNRARRPQARKLARERDAIPGWRRRVLAADPANLAVAEKYAQAREIPYMGRQFNFPIALEGALKPKEISYVHAEGYAPAEVKDGPIALISPDFPSVFVVSPRRPGYRGRYRG